MSRSRKIIHIDMDAFYASIEQRDNPAYRGKPVIVGGDPDRRGVVATASYEAREFGIRSAMASSTARRLCPNAVFLRPRMELYVNVSREIMAILRSYTDLVEPVSIDEAYLDATENKKGIPYASQIAQTIKEEIKATTSLTASAGVGPNKFIAKIASDVDKPDGLTVIRPEGISDFLHGLSVRKVPGIGPVTQEKMRSMGILTIDDLKEKSEDELVAVFGKAGRWYYSLSRGQDDRPVTVQRIRKSVGAETTFVEDLVDLKDMREALRKLASQVEARLENGDHRGRTITLKATYSDFEKVTRSRTLNSPVRNSETLYDTAEELLSSTDAAGRPVRLLGITVSNLDSVDQDGIPDESGTGQLPLPLA